MTTTREFNEEINQSKAMDVLSKGTVQALQTLRSLMRLGAPGNTKSSVPKADKPREALEYAKVRLEATKEFLALRFGTKARGPLTADAESNERRDLARLKRMPRPKVDELLARQIADGEITKEEADTLRRMIRGETWDDNGPPEAPAETREPQA